MDIDRRKPLLERPGAEGAAAGGAPYDRSAWRSWGSTGASKGGDVHPVPGDGSDERSLLVRQDSSHVRLTRQLSRQRRRKLQLHQRRIFSSSLVRPLLALAFFVAVGGFGLACFLTQAAGGGSGGTASCGVCCLGVAGVVSSGTMSVWLGLVIFGFAGPFVAVGCCAMWLRPTRRQRMREDFYADALLEEMLAGDNIRDHYDVCLPPGGVEPEGTVIFFSGLGAPRSASRVHTDALSRRFKTIAVDLPSHGTLEAVTYSLTRCEQVFNRVLVREAAMDAARRAGGGLRAGGINRDRAASLRRDRSVESIDVAPVIIAGYGPGAQAAMYLAARYPEKVCGLFVHGPCVDLSDPGSCGCGCCSGYGCFGCGCFFGHGFGCCTNGSALIGNAPCSSIYRTQWASFIEDAMIRHRISASTLPEHIKEQLQAEREFVVATAVDWNYEIRKKPLVDDLRGFTSPVFVLAGRTSSDFVSALQRACPQTDVRFLLRVGDQYLPVWRWRECNEELERFAGRVFDGLSPAARPAGEAGEAGEAAKRDPNHPLRPARIKGRLTGVTGSFGQYMAGGDL